MGKTAKPAVKAKQRARRARVAAALSEGASVSAIAAREGVCANTVISDASSEEVRVLIDRLVDRHSARIEKLFVGALTIIDEAQRALRYISVRMPDGSTESVAAGPDHYARLTSVKHLKDLCLANRPLPKHEERKPGTWTLDEWKEILALLGK